MTTPPLAPQPAVAPSGPGDLLASAVIRRVTQLQLTYMGNVSSTVRALAVLRRAISSTPGADPTVWADTIGLLDSQLWGRTDEPNANEWAVHAAMTLFATHQQSHRDRGMHRADWDLGRAVHALASQEGGEPSEAVRRRFQMLGTAQDLKEVLHHARGLVTQFRAAGITLDYGQLARDLRNLQYPGLASGVRLRWGRGFYRADTARLSTAADSGREPETSSKA